jgi:16S rRNA (guanine527-N7)-methyltransferase
MRFKKSTEFSEEMTLMAEKAAALGIPLSSPQIHLFQVYLAELWEWNKRFNLTGLKTRERIVIELFLDSLIPAPFLPDGGTMLDAGSGAGFPGVPLKIIHPRAEACLLESSAKKTTFLKHVVRSLQLKGILVIQGRIEAPGEWVQHEKFQVITARALADLRKVILWCSPLLQMGGFLVTFLGADGERAVELNQEVLSREGLRVDKHLSYVLPGKESMRHTFIFKKEGCDTKFRRFWPIEKDRGQVSLLMSILF